MTAEPGPATRAGIARTFNILEDIVYAGLGMLLAASALVLLGNSAIEFVRNIAANTLTQNIVALLDRILLIFLVVELLYTVQVSFQKHTIAPEPFLLVGVIAGIRRVLVITAEFGHVPAPADTTLYRFVIELAVLTVLVPVLVLSLLMLRKRESSAS
ncbi:MAG TPA: phosphate-starvation-inducible PsiE family protein [Thermoanaerobaculia bacterium]|nr:phosphate-starvation-inducible PsiE family protein [Thermoanaerobaculia bacterium]